MMSTGGAAMTMPESPPIMNMETNPMLNNIGVANFNRPPYMVPIQLKTLMPLGSAISMVETMNDTARIWFMPEMNMWWPHTIKPNPAIAVIE